jgi:hypothetical protein
MLYYININIIKKEKPPGVREKSPKKKSAPWGKEGGRALGLRVSAMELLKVSRIVVYLSSVSIDRVL